MTKNTRVELPKKLSLSREVVRFLGVRSGVHAGATAPPPPPPTQTDPTSIVSKK